MHDDIGFTRLRSELRKATPTGVGVSIAQVESTVAVDRDGSPTIQAWMPNTGVRDLKSRPIADRSDATPGVWSGHATGVARRIVGRTGLAAGADALDVFRVTHWIGEGALRLGTTGPPVAAPYRVTNHSWAGAGRNTQVLRRADWLTDRDEVIQVVGVRNAAGRVNHAYMAASMNAIVVGRSDGLHSVSTPRLDGIYAAGRTRPHLVAPLKTGSAAAPMVTGAVALLLETASDPSLSTRQAPLENRGGVLIYDAGRSEVIRAVLMAGADRETDNSASGNIAGYRARPIDRKLDGLDRRYGAGQLNVYNSWQILSAGEQEQSVSARGFDYAPALAAGSRQRYRLPVVARPARLSATLSWNLLFPGGEGSRFDASAVLNDLDLSLCEVVGDECRVVATSAGRIDTTESIYAELAPGSQYVLEAIRVDGGSLYQDYALAWQVAGDG